MALHEHLEDAGDAAEVAVDLEGRMGVEEVRVGARGVEQHLQDVVRVVAFAEAGPEVEPPGDAPPRRLVAADLEGPAGGGGERGLALDGDLAAREEGVEMRDVAVVDLGSLHVPVVEPLLELAGGADLVWRQARARGGEGRAQGRVDAEGLGGLDAVGEEVAQDLGVHRRAGAEAGAVRVDVLGRERRAGDEPLSRRLFDEGVEEELARQPLRTG